MIKKLQTVEESYIQFTDEELSKLGLQKGDKFTVTHDGEKIILKPYVKIELDMDEWSRDILEKLIKTSCEEHKPVDEIIEDILRTYVDRLKKV
jgi:bifunctional DNA-binding transcriptional regulator/antitoxin component of YhaV-PrlF toxin-antitoxin module